MSNFRPSPTNVDYFYRCMESWMLMLKLSYFIELIGENIYSHRR
jgi:hypothetical protein